MGLELVPTTNASDDDVEIVELSVSKQQYIDAAKEVGLTEKVLKNVNTFNNVYRKDVLNESVKIAGKMMHEKSSVKGVTVTAETLDGSVTVQSLRGDKEHTPKVHMVVMQYLNYEKGTFDTLNKSLSKLIAG